MMWASSLAHNGLTNCGRTVALTVHQFEHEVSAMYPKIAHGAGLAALDAIDAQEQYYESINMPTNLRVLGIKKDDLEVLALKCSRGKTRTLPGYMPLGYDDILEIFRMAYDA